MTTKSAAGGARELVMRLAIFFVMPPAIIAEIVAWLLCSAIDYAVEFGRPSCAGPPAPAFPPVAEMARVWVCSMFGDIAE